MRRRQTSVGLSLANAPRQQRALAPVAWSLANLVSSSGLSNGVGESKGALPVSEHLRVFGKLPSQCIN